MRATRARVTTFVVALGVGAVVACSDSAQPIGHGDKVINDTKGQPVSPPLPPPYNPGEGGYDAGEGGYAPALNTCGGCSCDPATNYCFSGGVAKAVLPAPEGLFGVPDAGDAGPPPPPCPILKAGELGNGCAPLPASCTGSPTCDCLLAALQPSYKCYLVCTPTPGFLEVYCPGGAGGSDGG